MDILLAGFGVVGQGVAEVLKRKGSILASRFNQDIRIMGAFDSRTFVLSQEGVDPDKLLATKIATGMVGEEEHHGNTARIIRETEFDVLVEVTPTNIVDARPAIDHIIGALETGKDVITCNKGPLALYYNRLAEVAESYSRRFLFEGAVGGAMPVINLSREILTGERILSIRGILNGTCNFILSRMGEERLPLSQALKEAQQLGYAEADPTYDIDGVDSALKLTILANAIMGMNVTFRDVRITGIRGITEEAIALAGEQKKVIRLIGEISDDRLEVSPRLVPQGHPLSIGGTLNMIQLKTDIAGEITVAGKGAGKMETASAVLSDLVTLLRENGRRYR